MSRPLPGAMVCPVFIGRQPDLSVLRLLMDRQRSEREHVILLSGEAGIGKSRLVAEAKTYAAVNDLAVFQGNCFQTDRTLPYAPLLELFRSYFASPGATPIADEVRPLLAELTGLLPDLALVVPDTALARTARVPDPEQQQWRLFAMMAHFFMTQATRHPVVLVIEDIHWCDDLSLEFLLHLARRCQQVPLLTLATYRSDEQPPRLAHWLAQLDRERLARELPLKRLAREDVAAMVRAMLVVDAPAGVDADLLDTLYTRSEGNPFFVEELLKSLLTAGELEPVDGAWKRTGHGMPVPRSIQEAVRQRLAYVSADARHLLTLAAVVGRRFNVMLLKELLGCDEARLLALLKEVTTAQLVSEESADQFAFRHALTQQAIYAELLVRERQALHRTIAETLQQLATAPFAREHSLEDLAYHCFEAGLWEQALTYSREAGERAMGLYAQQAAIHHLTRAAEAAHHLGQMPPARLYQARGQAHEALGEFEKARHDYERALDAARVTHDGEMEWQSLMALGFLWTERDYEQAATWLQAALALAERLADPMLRARSLNRLGNWLTNIGRWQEALGAHREALGIFEARADTRGMAETLDLLSGAYGLYGDKLTSADIEEQAIALFRDLGDNQTLSSLLATRALQSTGETSQTTFQALLPRDECLRDAEEALRLARQIGWLSGQAFAEVALSYVYSYWSELGEGLNHAREALRIATSIEHRQWIALSQLVVADTYLLLLQPALTLAAVDAGLPLARELGSELVLGTLVAAQAQAFIQAHELQNATAVLGEILPRERPPHTLAERQVAWMWGELALARGEPNIALQRADELLASVPGPPGAQPVPHLLKLRAEALAALGRLDEAAQSFDEAQRGAEVRHDESILWRIHRSRGHLYRRQKREEQAREEYNAARHIIATLASSLDDPLLRERFLRAALDSLPRDKPLSQGEAAKRSLGGLTAREREVAALVAQGHTSRVIAAILVLSERTVEVHVGNILSKLGFTSRAQIAVWAAEHELTKR